RTFADSLLDGLDDAGREFSLRVLPGGRVGRDKEWAPLHLHHAQEFLLNEFPQEGRAILDLDTPARADERPGRQVASIVPGVVEVRKPESRGEGLLARRQHGWFRAGKLPQNLQDDALGQALVPPCG